MGQVQGVVITHRMLLATLEGFRGYIDGLSYVDSFSDDDTVLSFLPLAHIMVRCPLLWSPAFLPASQQRSQSSGRQGQGVLRDPGGSS